MAKKSEKHLVGDSSSSVIREAYKNARTNLLFSITNKGYKNILITSSLPSEGKSTTCANLAISFAQIGKRVLIIDADLRHPIMNKLFLVKQSPGLSDLLAGLYDFRTCIKDTHYKNLWLLPGGTIPPNPSELLLSDKYTELIQRIYDQYDIIFIDTPPTTLFTDSVSICRQSDCVVLVTMYAKTTKESLERMIDKFEKVEANLLGVIINKISKKKYFEQTGSRNGDKYYEHYRNGNR